MCSKNSSYTNWSYKKTAITALHSRKWNKFIHKLAPEGTIVPVSLTEEGRKEDKMQFWTSCHLVYKCCF